jgi:hypothetical protein
MVSDPFISIFLRLKLTTSTERRGREDGHGNAGSRQDIQ